MSKKSRVVRARFDALEEGFEVQLLSVLRQAAEAKERGGEAVARVLDGFTQDCVSQVVTVLRELLDELESFSLLRRKIYGGGFGIILVSTPTILLLALIGPSQ